MIVFLALAGLLTVLWRKELAMKRQRGAATPARKRNSEPQEVGDERSHAQLLWLPEQASTFAPRVDHLHYFVIT